MSRKAYVGVILAALLPAMIAGCGGAPTPAERGQQVFKTCVPCHGPKGHGDLALRAPSIAGLPAWYVTAELKKFKDDIRGAHPDDGEGARMRPMARTLYHEGDIDAVANHLAAMPATWIPPVVTGGDVEAGKKQYTSVCIACHGADANGTQAMNAPPLHGQADWYLIAQLKKFKTGMRGAHPQDGTGAQMRAMSTTLVDTVAMHNVVAYIKSLPH